MKKGVLLSVGVIIVAIVLVLVAGHKKTTPETTSTNTTTQNSNTASTPNTKTVSKTDVMIKDMAFDAQTVTIKKGTAVTWTNNDSVDHTVTFDDDSLSKDGSGNISTGDAFSHTFDTVGSFNYHCSIHSSMTGTVVVTE